MLSGETMREAKSDAQTVAGVYDPGDFWPRRPHRGELQRYPTPRVGRYYRQTGQPPQASMPEPHTKYQPRLHIVLHQPEIPYNTGSVGRTCVAIGAKLWLVRPLGFRVDDYYLRRAGLDYWECLTVRYHENLQALKQTVDSGRFFYASTKASRLYTEVKYSQEDYLVFGSETRGLASELIEEHPETAIRIPMWGAKPRSHNLSNAAAIVVYEALRQIRGF
jgi:tRNA (cytidine/uridine-2'-O-)-methyltransferase